VQAACCGGADEQLGATRLVSGDEHQSPGKEAAGLRSEQEDRGVARYGTGHDLHGRDGRDAGYGLDSRRD
jgi:hypothetical protein